MIAKIAASLLCSCDAGMGFTNVGSRKKCIAETQACRVNAMQPCGKCCQICQTWNVIAPFPKTLFGSRLRWEAWRGRPCLSCLRAKRCQQNRLVSFVLCTPTTHIHNRTNCMLQTLHKWNDILWRHGKYSRPTQGRVSRARPPPQGREAQSPPGLGSSCSLPQSTHYAYSNPISTCNL